MSVLPGSSLRERSRRAIQSELLQVAQRLFVEQGYGETSVDQIAAAAGMSRRTLFRYVSSKEELVLAKYDLVREECIDRLRARPSEEPVWVAMRRMFDGIVGYLSDPQNASPAAVVQRIVASTPELQAGALLRLEQMQRAICLEVIERYPRVSSLTAAALVGAAFACLSAAQAHAERTGDALGPVLDEVMTVLTPAI